MKGHTGIESFLIPNQVEQSRNRYNQKSAVLKIPSNPIDHDKEKFGSNKKLRSKKSVENSLEKKEKSTGLEIKKDHSGNSHFDKTLKKKGKFRPKIIPGLDLSNSALSPSPSQDLAGVFPKIISPNIENISKLSSDIKSPENLSSGSAN